MTSTQCIRPGGRWILAALVLTSLVLAACSTDGGSDGKAGPVGVGSTTVGIQCTTSTGATSTTSSSTTTSPSTSTPTTSGVEIADPAMSVHTVVPHRGVYRSGKLYLEGDVPSRKVAAAIIAKAEAVVGKGNVIDGYRIDAAAPAISDGRVVIDEPLLFATNSAVLGPVATTLVPLGVAVMKLNPKVIMRVTGYTDDVGEEGDNLALAALRAQALVDAIAPQGVDRTRFRVSAKGESSPVAPNDTPAGRQLNRRIEVDLINLLG